MNYNYNYNVVRFCFFILLLFHHACSSCEASDRCHSGLSTSVITKNEERDLELFDSLNQSHQGIFSVFDKTYTASGKLRLMYHLKNPTTDVSLLKLRQEQIKFLLENPTLLEEIKGLLARIKAAEPDLLYFINNQEDPVAHTIIDTFYFKNTLLKDLNESSIALDVRNYLKQLGLFSPVIEHLVFHFALSFIQEKLTQNPTEHHHHHHDHEAHHDHAHSNCSHYCVSSLKAPADSSTFVKGAFTALKAAHFGMHLLGIKEMIQQMGAELAVVNQLYKKVASVKEGLHAIITLHNRMQESNYVYNSFASQLVDSDTLNIESNIKFFAPLLDSTYFDSNSSLGYFSPIGNTVYNYQLLKNNASLLQSFMAAVADIDALVSIVEWCKEQTTKKAPVCFVDFVTGVCTPVIVLEGMRHVGLSPDDAVMNDIELSADKGAYKFIITGPNKSGKSTIIKAVGLNIILAQTFGIAAAHNAKITVFRKLLTYITITDDIVQDRSLFVAELLRAEECIQALQSLPTDELACILLDDSLFKGTSLEKSQDIALRFLIKIGSYSNSCALIATHCAALTQLEEENPTIFKNYRIKIGADAQGNAESLFILEEGIANQAAVFDVIKGQRTASFLDN